MTDIHELETSYKKMKNAMFVLFSMFLGGGTVMIELSIVTHNVIFWAFGFVLAITSGVFITIGMVSKKKLKAMSN